MNLENTVNQLSEAHSIRAFKQILGLRGKSQEVVSKIESWLNGHRNEFQIDHIEKLKKMNWRVTLLWNQDLGAAINRIFLKCLLPDDDSIAESLSPFVNRSMNQEDLEILIRAIKKMPDSHPSYCFQHIAKFFHPSEKTTVPSLCSSLNRETMRGIDIKIIFFAVHRLNTEVRSKAIELTSSLMAADPKITEGDEVARILEATLELLPEEEETCKKFALLKIPRRSKALMSLRKVSLQQRPVVINAAIDLLKPYPYCLSSNDVISILVSIPENNFPRVLELSMPFIKRIHQKSPYYRLTCDKLIPVLRQMRDFQQRESLSLEAVKSAATLYLTYGSDELISHLKMMASFPIDQQEKICSFIAKISKDLIRFALYLKVFKSIDTRRRLLALDLLKDYVDDKDSPTVNFAKFLKKHYLWSDCSSLPVLLLAAFERGPSFRDKFTTGLHPVSNKLATLCQAIDKIPPSYIDSLIELMNVNPKEITEYSIEIVREDLNRFFDAKLLMKVYPHLDRIFGWSKAKITMIERAKYIPNHRWDDYFRLYNDDRVVVKDRYGNGLKWEMIFVVHRELKEDCLKFLSSKPEMEKEFLTYLDKKE